MSTRGNSLMVTMIALAVLMVLVVGAIRFTGTNRQAAVSKLKGDRMAACAETARRYVLSQLRISGTQVTSLVLDPYAGNTYALLPDDPVPANRSAIGPGHYGQDVKINTGGATPTRVGLVPIASIGSAGRQVGGAENRIRKGNPGGDYFAVTMKCQEPGAVGVGREAEVEFVFRYGL